MKRRANLKESGVALLMVIVMIAITSALLMSLTESTFISMRINRASEQRIKAESLLKSAFNIAQVLIKNDSTAFDDENQDWWMMFKDSKPIPVAYLDPVEPNALVQMLIVSENGKIPLLSLVNGNTPHPDWPRVLLNLFVMLGFDNQKPPDISIQCQFEQPSFCSSAEMVANLIDYLDQDEVSLSWPSLPAQGIESDLPMGERFRNLGALDSIEELFLVPGFTADRVNTLLPFITIESTSPISDKVNANAAHWQVLQAVANLDPGAPADAGIELKKCQDPSMLGPVTTSIQSFVNTCFSNAYPNLGTTMQPLLKPAGTLYRVIARVDYGTSNIAFMGTAIYQVPATGQPPKLRSMFLY
jgi:type II secretory pathway component PulK